MENEIRSYKNIKDDLNLQIKTMQKDFKKID